jgi:hypothetical protein
MLIILLAVGTEIYAVYLAVNARLPLVIRGHYKASAPYFNLSARKAQAYAFGRIGKYLATAAKQKIAPAAKLKRKSARRDIGGQVKAAAKSLADGFFVFRFIVHFSSPKEYILLFDFMQRGRRRLHFQGVR